ncbi:MAG: DEAD/DEAH box helicase [Phycisphaerae bacterium]|nr:DEAD/DEAH box helicase [Phycisphaerae bacterium]
MSHKQLETPPLFAKLGLETPILQAIAAMNFREPTEIQSAMIPHVLAGRDVLGQARTGTGKTAAFGLPLLQRVDPSERMQALVLTPTRELAAQVLGDFRRFAAHLPIHCVPVYGGHGLRQQLHQLGKKPHVATGTPGRVLDLMQRGALDLSHLRFAVLDEVDRMLDIGFRDDIRRILGRINHAHQTVFVSATIDGEIRKLAMQYMNDPVELNVSRDVLTTESVDQHYVSVEPWDKYRLLMRVLDVEKPTLIIVFTNTKHAARKLAKRLHAGGIEAKEIHGDLVQQKRERIMDRFRRHKIPVLVATDLAARGIDVSGITHILNYDLPQDPHVYVHRIGRTARMGAFGKAISFVTREQGKQLTEIEKLINREIVQWTVDGFEPSPPPREHDARAMLPTVIAERPPGAAEPAPPRPKPATLGGKFPVSRRRRRP